MVMMTAASGVYATEDSTDDGPQAVDDDDDEGDDADGF